MKKSVVTVITALSLTVTLALGLTACGSGDGGEHNHDWAVESSTASCGEAGNTVFKCECGESKTEETSASGNHSYGSGKVCSVCGYVNFSGMTVAQAIAEYGYFVEDKDGSKTYSTGDAVYFGSYPQNTVEDTAVLSSLEQQVGDVGEWTAYGYYSEGQVSDYMFYKDITLNGIKYRGVYLGNYRPYYSGLTAGADHSYIDDEGFDLETVYWFEYAPVQWRVLEYKNGNMFLASEYSIDAQPYQDTYEISGGNYVIPDTAEYVNNWKNSSLRAFLNETFYNAAFSEAQKALIQNVTLDNSTTGYAGNSAYQTNQRNTQDRVYLLSYADVNNTGYGYSAKGSSRVRSYTDYSVVQGLRTSSESSTEDGEPASFYMLRSAGSTSYGICGVTKSGSVSYNTSALTDESVDGVAINGDLGILPALNIRVGKATQGVWNDFTVENDGAEVECSVYVPAAYKGGDELPLITYIADSSYATLTLSQYKTAQCPKAWITDEKMSENPAFFLIMCGSPSASFAVSVIDKIADDYGIDESRLYLTGQSMGGITDFLINDTYPDKFAATVYVDCQPGGEVHDAQYDEIIANAKFLNQKFVYIASRKDQLAAQGQDDVEQVLKDNDVGYGKLYDLDHKGGDALNSAVKEILDRGFNHNFFGFTQVTPSGNTAAEHMQSFQYGYAIDAIFDWLMAQHK